MCKPNKAQYRINIQYMMVCEMYRNEILAYVSCFVRFGHGKYRRHICCVNLWFNSGYLHGHAGVPVDDKKV